MSRPTQDRAIVDAGLKSLAFDSGPPLVCDEPAGTGERASDERAAPAFRAPSTASTSPTTSASSPATVTPPSTSTTGIVGIRGDRVEQLWPITARGVVYRL
jgi:hypothetical protein